MIPAVLMACVGLVAVIVLINTAPLAPEARPVLALAGAGAVAILLGTIFAAETVARRAQQLAAASARQVEAPEPRPVEPRPVAPPPAEPRPPEPRLDELASLILRGREELRGLCNRIAVGEVPPYRGVGPRPAENADLVTRLVWELQQTQTEAWNALVDAAASPPPSSPERRVEIFVNLSLRMQTLLHRALQSMDELENRVEDPDLLKGLFRVDHLTARLRRQAESLAVVGGASPRRQWSRPVSVYEVVRSAIAEVEHFRRVKVVPPVEGTLDGGAVADVVHLLAELIENATKFAPPHMEVFVRVEAVTAGLAIEVEDRGLGIPLATQHRLNDLLSQAEQVNTDQLLEEGRIGLLVVATLARRHKAAVKLLTNIYGGTQAVVVVPNELIGSEVPGVGAHPAPSGDLIDSAANPPSSRPPGPAAQSRNGTVPNPVPNGHAAPPPQQTVPPEPVREQRTNAPAQPDGRFGPPAPAPDARRPELPRRQAQTNLIPELQDAPAAPEESTDAQPNPGLMAAFRKGMRDGE